MNKSSCICAVLLPLACLVGCSGGIDTTELPDPGRPYTLEEVYPDAEQQPARAELVDVIEWRSERIEFWNTAEAGAEPQILTTFQGTPAEGEIMALLQGQTDLEVTPAELWRQVTGREDVPEALAQAHKLAAAQGGRTADYQTFGPLVREKAFSFDALFPLNTAGVCWNAKVITANVGAHVGINTSTVCSSTSAASSTVLRTTPVSTASTCPVSLATKLRNRAGAYYQSGPANAVTRMCYNDSGSTGWKCLNSFSFVPGQYYAGEYGATSFTHRFGVGVDTPEDDNYVVKYGAATIKTGVPRFEDNSCNGF